MGAEFPARDALFRPSGRAGLPSPALARSRYDSDTMSVVAAPPAERLRFKLGPATLALDVADGTALEVLERVYAPMRCADLRPHQHSASIQTLSDGRLHARFARRPVVIPPRTASERLMYSTTREIFARFAASVPQTLALYGAMIAVRNSSMLLLGPAMIGKSVLALHLAHQGATFLGDETAMLSLRGPEAYAMPRRPALRESAVAHLPDRMRDSVATAPHSFEGDFGRFWYALDERDLAGIAPSDRAFPLEYVCILRNRAQEPAIRRLDTAAAVPHIAQRAYARPSELHQLSALHKTLRKVRCLEITLGTPEETASAILREVGACG